VKVYEDVDGLPSPDWRDHYSVKDMTDDQLHVWEMMNRAFHLYLQREGERKSVWRRSGLKGTVFMLYTKADRAFQQTFSLGQVPNIDHFVDAVVYGAFGMVYLTQPEDDKRDPLNGVWPW